MSTGGSIRAGKAFVEIGAKDKLTKVLGSLRKRLNQFGGLIAKVMKIGAAAIAAFGAAAFAAVKTFARMGDLIDKAMKRTGLGAQELTELKHAAEESDVSFQQLTDGIFRMQRLKPGMTFEEAADQVAALEGDVLQTAKAYSIFGRQAKDLLPILKLGSKGIREQREEARRLGVTMTDEDAVAAAELTDQMAALWKQVKMVVFQFGKWITASGGVAGGLKDVSLWLGDLLAFMRSGDMENAWELMWNGMLVSLLTVLDQMSKPFKEFIDDIVNGFRSAQNQITIAGGHIAKVFDKELGQSMIDQAEERQKFESDIGKGIKDSLDSAKRRMQQLSAEADKIRAKEKAAAGASVGNAQLAAQGAFGTFSADVLSRQTIQATDMDSRIATATEDTATATRAMAGYMRRWTAARPEWR